MSVFVDKMMLSLRDPANLRELVSPAADPSHARVKQLFAAVYTLPFATVHEVLRIDVLATDFQRPIFPPRRLTGIWMQTIPSHVRTDVQYEGLDGLVPEWLDVSARLALTVVLEVDAGEVESIRLNDIGTFATLEEFKAKFRYFDLDVFMTEHGITTVEELKNAYRYLLGEIKLKDPSPFDPSQPANQRRFDLNLAVLIREGIDVAGHLRDARLAREAVERSLPYRREVGEAEVTTPYAPVVVLPEAAVAASGFSQADLEAFFASQQVLAVFVTS